MTSMYTNGNFIERVSDYMHLSMSCFCVLSKRATIQDLAGHVTSLTKLQKPSHLGEGARNRDKHGSPRYNRKCQTASTLWSDLYFTPLTHLKFAKQYTSDGYANKQELGTPNLGKLDIVLCKHAKFCRLCGIFSSMHIMLTPHIHMAAA